MTTSNCKEGAFGMGSGTAAEMELVGFHGLLDVED